MALAPNLRVQTGRGWEQAGYRKRAAIQIFDIQLGFIHPTRHEDEWYWIRINAVVPISSLLELPEGAGKQKDAYL